ncbi:MAG: hypothetical protein HY606_11355 [Planctomycetes bacterium]|nr:hypothetical protein [Planctomycetota bacterium]
MNSRLLGLLAVAVIISLLATLIFYKTTTKLVFEVELESSVQGTAQLFYDVGNGFNENDSARVYLSTIPKKYDFSFELPRHKLRGFRFDPIDRESSITISHARIITPGYLAVSSKVIHSFAPEDFKAGNQIKSILIDGEMVRINTVEEANDPTLIFSLKEPISFKILRYQIVWHLGFIFLQFLLLLTACLFILGFTIKLLRSKFALLYRQVVIFLRINPDRTIIVVAVCSAILSSYPVVFFGKSFVSPDYGGFLLYDRMPTLPGYETTRIEYTNNTDVLAMMVGHFPYSVVQSKALWKDAELPLWNRYNSTGVTLLGQGQSMFGDPFHMIVLAAGGASWAWDVKFVVAKILFAIGIGLFVYVIIQSLPIALLLTISAPFIGFFTFRLNHPAIFSLCYAPWILYMWLRIVGAQSGKASTLWSCGLVLANLFELTSGTAKEAYMLIMSLNICGGLVLMFSSQEIKAKLIKLLKATAAGILFVLITAPIWLTFLTALQSAYTIYNSPHAIQINPSLTIGLFDDIFYRQIMKDESIYCPSANFFVLFGVLWSVACLKHMLQNRTYIAIGLSSLISFALAFGVIPWELIFKIPNLKNVHHLDNTFSVVLIIHLLILAGFGLKRCFDELKTREWKFDWFVTLFFLVMMLSLYFGYTKDIHKSGFFYGYTALIVLAATLLPWIFRWLAQGSHPIIRKMLITLLVVVMVLLHWRHGMHLPMPALLDPYVNNPPLRANLQAKSNAIGFIKSDIDISAQPFRAVGLQGNLAPGYSGALGVEGINGIDALLNPYRRELLRAIPFDCFFGWNWGIIVKEQKLSELKPMCDFFNVKYYLSPHKSRPSELQELHFDGGFDLDVYSSQTVWPRAFFTDKLLLYDSVADLVTTILNGDRKPFAAFQKSDSEQYFELKDLQGDQKSRVVVPASDYKLTTNTTSFTVDAPSKGIVVLTEAYLKDDFVVKLNDKEVPYYRMNHAYKGIIIDAPGKYVVSFSYWPTNFTLSLWMALTGLLLMGSWILFTIYKYRRLKK